MLLSTTVVLAASALPQVHAATSSSTTASGPVYEPLYGQQGKDVIWVPTGNSLIDRMLNLAKLTSNDYLVDLGSGDGRTVIAAAKRGARAHGIEYNPDLVALSVESARKEGVSEKATFAQGDIFESDFSEATVVTMFLLPSLNLRLRPTLLEMKPGTRIVSNSFTMGDWSPDASDNAGPNCQSFCQAYLWIVPAKVRGTWNLQNQERLQLTQTYQELNGSLSQNGTEHPISNGKVQGNTVQFTANGVRYTATVKNSTLTGQTDDGTPWSAALRQ